MERYFLSATGDTRDRAPEIEEKLEKFGVCILGAGEFFVSGIKMPEGSSLTGFSDATGVILSEEVREGAAVTLSSRCTVKDLSLFGRAPGGERPTVEKELWGDDGLADRPSAVGGRHGIAFLGNAFDTKAYGEQPRDGILSGLRIEWFSGGGITGCDTGYSIEASLCVSDCRIKHCGAGINLSFFSEYHKFSNVVSTRNLYGCINNGGNNVFSACSFDGNTMGYLIDNSEKQSRNNAHGSCVGCTFNHTDSNNGVGIKILGSQAGYVFSGCQIYYSKIVVERSSGIQLANVNFGKNEEIFVKGGGVVRFSGCLFSNPPAFVLEDTEKVFVDDCYTKGGSPVTL